ncbi:MAG: appr-p processing enzyme family protein [Verrucomicrobiales bacterium]|nr:appr-p processing enzyme family protein [Verrucomicrobiales bacterium]
MRMMTELKLILVDPNLALCSAWSHHFSGMSGVHVRHGRFEELTEFDCMVSAANSFGLMDGGVDLAITKYFGSRLMERVQWRVLSEYLGEQPVGTSMIVETDHPDHPFIAHTPTMRVPMPIATTDNVYSATWAMLVAVARHNQTQERKIATIACPGLGTATGTVPEAEAARQMALAYRWFCKPPTRIDWTYANVRQMQIGRGGDIRWG